MWYNKFYSRTLSNIAANEKCPSVMLFSLRFLLEYNKRRKKFNLKLLPLHAIRLLSQNKEFNMNLQFSGECRRKQIVVGGSSTKNVPFPKLQKSIFRVS